MEWAKMLKDWENKRAASVARMTEIMTKASEDSRTLSEEEEKEYDGLQAEVKSIDAHITRVKAHAAQSAASATPAPTGTNLAPIPGAQPVGDPADTASKARGGSSIISVSSNLPKGTTFARYAMALASARGEVSRAVEIASKRWKDSPEVAIALKAAMDPGTTTDTTWAAPLAELTVLASEFVELLYPLTILGRLPGLRRIPFQVKIPRATAGSTVGWVGQNAPKPVSEMAFDTLTLGFAKIAGIVVLTEELVRFSTPSAEAEVRNNMLEVVAQFMDKQFIDPTVAAVNNVSPASVTNGVTPRVSTGGGNPTVAQVTADVKAILSNIASTDINIGSAVWVMNPRTALTLSMLRTSQDVFAFPGLTMQGGTFFGIPVITSNNVPLSSPTGDSTIIVLIVANEVYLADDGATSIDVSRDASLQLNSTPSAGAQALVSLWQNNLVGLKAERFANWMKRRSAGVQYISEVQY